jgi:hypothetical protein
MTGKRRERGEKFKKKGQPTGGLRKKKGKWPADNKVTSETTNQMKMHRVSFLEGNQKIIERIFYRLELVILIFGFFLWKVVVVVVVPGQISRTKIERKKGE